MKKINLDIDNSRQTPLYKQIKTSFEQLIQSGKISPGEKLPSINRLSSDYRMAAGTVVRAYEELLISGLISSRQGKGYYVSLEDSALRLHVFLLFDRMNAFKEILYDTFRKEFDDKTDIQVFFHHYDFKRFDKLIRENAGKFTHYVIMPHLRQDIRKILNLLPPKKTIFIDNLPANLKPDIKAVYQDFYVDIQKAMEDCRHRLTRYKKIFLSLSQSPFQFVPDGIVKGFINYCQKNHLNYEVIQNISDRNLLKGCLYIIFDDGELLFTLKLLQQKKWKLKTDVGIISYDETPMKELLAGGISVLSTDFVKMGKTAAALVREDQTGQIANPFQFINRESF